MSFVQALRSTVTVITCMMTNTQCHCKRVSVVHYIIYRYSGWVEQEDDGIDIAKALLVAAKANHIKVVDIILRNDDDAFQDDSRKSVLHVQLNGEEMWKIAVQEGLSSIFEVCIIFFPITAFIK